MTDLEKLVELKMAVWTADDKYSRSGDAADHVACDLALRTYERGLERYWFYSPENRR